MKLIKPDHERRIDIEGIPGPVNRPVDIDQAKTGFTNLRTLRIYRFEPGHAVDGHAEEDEVFIVVLAGSAEISMTADGFDVSATVLNAATPLSASPCGAYLPPNGTYRLVPRTLCDVAYARATPVHRRPARVLVSSAEPASDGTSVLLDELACAEKLRLKLLQLEARSDAASFSPLSPAEHNAESLLHVSGGSHGTAFVDGGQDSPVSSVAWDTLAIAPGEVPRLRCAPDSLLHLLLVRTEN